MLLEEAYGYGLTPRQFDEFDMLDFLALRKAKYDERRYSELMIRRQCYYSVAAYLKKGTEEKDLFPILGEQEKPQLTIDKAKAIRQKYIDLGIIKADGSERIRDQNNSADSASGAGN